MVGSFNVDHVWRCASLPAQGAINPYRRCRDTVVRLVTGHLVPPDRAGAAEGGAEGSAEGVAAGPPVPSPDGRRADGQQTDGSPGTR